MHDQTHSIPLCAVFGKCGGCKYQHLSYEEELHVKTLELHQLFKDKLDSQGVTFEPIVPSPEIYHYRHRLDLGLRRTRAHGILIGFMAEAHHQIIEIDACPIAMAAISDFIPKLKKEAIEKLPEKYRAANLTLKTGDDGKVLWGGIGKKSLRREKEDYLWVLLNDQKIYFSLDTFFQANFSILPRLAEILKNIISWNSKTLFFDLYGGVGLFSLILSSEVKQVILIEENPASIQLAKYNVEQNNIANIDVYLGRVEDLTEIITQASEKFGCQSPKILMVDPPRKGLGVDVASFLSEQKKLESILYLSCNPISLVEDLSIFLNQGWTIQKIIPFDFFPRTKHLEVLVHLTSAPKNL